MGSVTKALSSFYRTAPIVVSGCVLPADEDSVQSTGPSPRDCISSPGTLGPLYLVVPHLPSFSLVWHPYPKLLAQ